MREIDQKTISLAYDVARYIHIDQQAADDGVTGLASHGMNAPSARIYIVNLRAIVEGKILKRIMSAFSFVIYLGRIAQDFGTSAAEKAIYAVRAHVAYYKSLGRGNLNRVMAICDESEARLAR